MRSALAVVVGDTWLDALGLGYSPPAYSSTFGSAGGGGCEEASTVLSAPVGYRHPLLMEGNRFQVMLGSFPMFTGLIDEIDRDTWTIHAQGLSKSAADATALDGAGDTTKIANTAIDVGIANDFLRYWRRTGNIASTALGAAGTTDSPNTIQTLLDGFAERFGQWWTVRADGIIRMESLPTVPMYHLIPKSVDLPISYAEYASDVALRYFDSTSHTAKTVTSQDARAHAAHPKQVTVDATPLGEVSAAYAQVTADRIITQGKSRPGYTASIEATGWQILSQNFGPVDVRRVREGEMVRLHGVTNDLNGTPWHDIVIGRVAVNGADSAVQIDPMGLVTNGSQEDVIAKVLGAAWERKFKG